ncbi:hypothetical protein AAC03nite_28420 [Alicyclobacillus acidoterrestris]|nr:hypothetical protein AAC03nite_28420 [Alicyclobacillus acidoterrestris]
MADALGVKRPRYNAWENNISNPDHKMLAKIAQFHHVTTDFLLGLPHPEGIHLLTEDMYADGYTDESFFDDLERQLEKELENKDEVNEELKEETKALARKYINFNPDKRELLRKLIDTMDKIEREERDEE